MQGLKAFVHRHRKGLVLRSFATKVEDVPKRVHQVLETVDIAQGIEIEGKPAFDRIDIMIFVDARFGARADCGLTAEAMRSALSDHRCVYVHAEPGDLFCGVLNRAIAEQTYDRVTYSTILSPDARKYLNTETLSAVYQAAAEGALAASVVIDELAPSVLDGRLTNTFCCWNNKALIAVGGFDSRAAMPFDDRMANYRRGYSPEKSDPVYYAQAGVEEMGPLAQLVDLYGECLAPVLPRGPGIKAYEVPNPVTQRDLWERHISKLGTKIPRQDFFLGQAGFDPSWLRRGVMRKYRQP